MIDEDDNSYEGVEKFQYSWWRKSPGENVPEVSTQRMRRIWEEAQEQAEQSLWETLFGK